MMSDTKMCGLTFWYRKPIAERISEQKLESLLIKSLLEKNVKFGSVW